MDPPKHNKGLSKRVVSVVETLEIDTENEEQVMDTPERDRGVLEPIVEASEEDMEVSEHNREAPDQTVEAPDQTVEAPDHNVKAPEQTVEAPDHNMDASEQIVEAPEQDLPCRVKKTVKWNNPVDQPGPSRRAVRRAPKPRQLRSTADAFRDMDLTHKTAIITDACSDVGKATALLLAKRGANVCLHARTYGKMKKVLELFLKNGLQTPLAVIGDLEDANVRRDLLCHTLVEYHRLDILVSNAEADTNPLSFDETTEDHLRRLMRTNVEMPFEFVKLAMPELIRFEGNIVFVSSMAAGTGLPTGIAYAASKAAQSNMMKSLAAALVRHKARCNAVNPALPEKYCVRESHLGFRKPDVFLSNKPTAPLRQGEVKDIAEMIAFLVSDAASYITGQEHYVDGGKTSCFLG